MAVRAATFNRTVSKDGSVLLVTWTGLTNTTSDSGSPIMESWRGEKTFQAYGTFGTNGNVVIEGSNNGVDWSPLSNRQGTNMTFTATGFNRSQDQPVFVRPRITNGDGTTNLTVSVACHRTDLAEPN